MIAKLPTGGCSASAWTGYGYASFVPSFFYDDPLDKKPCGAADRSETVAYSAVVVQLDRGRDIVRGVRSCVRGVRSCVRGVRSCVRGVRSCVYAGSGLALPHSKNKGSGKYKE